MENTIGHIALIMAIAVIGQLISIGLEWRKFRTWSKIIVSIWLPLQLIGAAGLLLVSWGTFPWGRASAFKAADRFLTATKQGNYIEASQYMQPCVRNSVGVDNLGTSNETKPVSWQWTDYKNYSAFVSTIGTAKFMDGAELQIKIELMWNVYKWEVYAVTFGDPYKNPRLQLICRSP